MNELQRQSQDKIMHDMLVQDWKNRGLMVFNRDGSEKKSGTPTAPAFWKGFNGEEPHLIPKGTLLYAAYKAGKTCARKAKAH